jgi:hypothetical protein
VQTDAPGDVIAYRRGGALVLVNARPRPVRATVSGVSVNGARDLLYGGRQEGETVALQGYGAAVLEVPR